MPTFLQFLASSLRDLLRSRLALQMEVFALRHQLAVYQRADRRPRIQPADRVVWSWLSRHWSRWREVLVFVQPETVIAWRRRRFRDHWRRLSRSGKPGRPLVAKEVQDLIRRMSSANPLWGAPRIVGELGKIGIAVTKSTVDKYRVRSRKPPSATWRAFLKNHAPEIVAADFFVVPTVRNQVLFVFLLLAHDRRRVLHFNVTSNPTAAWTAQQMVEAFPDQDPPRFLLRDRDGAYGQVFRKRVAGMGFREILIAPRSPWQNPYVERLIGTIRCDCLNHVIVVNEQHLRRILRNYLDYYHRYRTHRSLDMDCPEPRPVQPIESGPVIELPDVGGLHHHYCRRAA